jgi:hypothetical protein
MRAPSEQPFVLIATYQFADVVIAMLRQPEGATVDEVASVTGWQRHTVRGVFSKGEILLCVSGGTTGPAPERALMRTYAATQTAWRGARQRGLSSPETDLIA